MSHKFTRHPFGTSPASVRASRNLLYLSNAGVIPVVNPSARMALELTNDNIRKANQKDQRQTARAVLQAGQEAANSIWMFPSLPLSNRRLRKLGLGA